MINAGFLFSEPFLWYLCGRKILSCLQCHRQKIGTRMFGLHCQILSTAMWAESTRWYWYLYLYFQGLKKGFFFYISLTPVKIILLSFFHISKFAVSTSVCPDSVLITVFLTSTSIKLSVSGWYMIFCHGREQGNHIKAVIRIMFF